VRLLQFNKRSSATQADYPYIDSFTTSLNALQKPPLSGLVTEYPYYVLKSVGLETFRYNEQPIGKIEIISIQYQGKTVKSKRLTVYLEIPININAAWQNAQTPALLPFVVKDITCYRIVRVEFPEKWKKGRRA